MPSILLSDNGVSSGSAGLKSTAASDGALALQTTTAGGTATTAVTIDTSQNMGLGVTPSAWSGFTALQIQNGALFTDSTSFRSIMNGYYNGSNWIYSTTNAATRYEQVNGIHRWFNAASGTAGNAITFTQAMTLDASGNLGVGTTSPPSGSRIAISGGALNFTETSARDILWGTSSYVYITGNQGTGVLAMGTGGSERARIDSSGNFMVGTTGNTYRISSTVASGADREMFIAGVSGVTNGFQVNYINSGTALAVRFNNITTTASAANAFLDSADGNRIYRSTSSLRYKTDIENIEAIRSDSVLNLRPVWYRSKATDDKKDWSWYGLIAEEVAEVEPRLVHWSYLDSDYDFTEENGQIKKTLKEGAKQVPDGVQYERVSVLLIDVVKRQEKAIQELKAEFDAYKATHP